MTNPLPSGRTGFTFLRLTEEIVIRWFALTSMVVGTLVVLPFRLLVSPFVDNTPRRKYKSVLITGASQGIGEQLAYEFAKENARVILVARNLANLESVADKCRTLGASEAVARACDVTDKEQMEKIILEADDAQPLDCVIANAGILSHTINTNDMLRDSYEPSVNINVNGCLNTIQPIAIRMRDRQSGQLVIMASIAGLMVPRHDLWGAYAATKAFQVAYGAELRATLKEHNVGVTVLAPGYVDTDMGTALGKAGQPMPGKYGASAAAKYMKSQVEANRALVTFSFMRYIYQTLPIMPDGLLDYVYPLVNKVFIGNKKKELQAYNEQKSKAAVQSKA